MIDEIKLVYFLNKTQLAFIDENGSTYIGALTIKNTKRNIHFNINLLKVIN